MSKPEDSPLICDPSDKARLEAANGVEQIDYIAHLVLERGVDQVRESHVFELHRLAVDGIYPCGGQYRNAWRRVHISGSRHEVPHESQVPSLVPELLDYLNGQRTVMPALKRAAYALWRLNWIHPFAGGNGRTSRAIAYLIVCADMGSTVPGRPQMPTLIAQRRDEYLACLRAADGGVQETGTPQLDPMVEYVTDIVTQQMASALMGLSVV